MPEIMLTHKFSRIQCLSEDYENAILIRIWTYSLKPWSNEVSNQTDTNMVRLSSDIHLRFPIKYIEGMEASIKYVPYIPFSSLSSIKEETVPDSYLKTGSVFLPDIFDFEALERKFPNNSGSLFTFDLIIRENINLDDLRQKGLIIENITQNSFGRVISIQNVIIDQDLNNYEVLILEYPQRIGDLNQEIISDISAFQGVESIQFQLQISGLDRYITLDNFKEYVRQALMIQATPVFQRIPKHLEILYPELQGNLFTKQSELVARLNLESGKQCKIDVKLHDPTMLFYKTDIEQINRCLASIHSELIVRGVALDTREYAHQKVLCELALYRHHCASRPNYIKPEIVEKTEIEGFHQHLLDRLGHNNLAIDVISEPDIGNSRLDLLISGYPVELKLETRKTLSTDEIVDSYKHQAADYIARRDAPFGFLLVLDTVLERDVATSSVEQDMKLVDVETASGAIIPVVAIIVRIPRKASDLTEIHRARKKK